MCEMFTFLSRYARASCLQRLQIFIFGTKTQRRKLRRARVYSAAAATAAATAAAVAADVFCSPSALSVTALFSCLPFRCVVHAFADGGGEKSVSTFIRAFFGSESEREIISTSFQIQHSVRFFYSTNTYR